MRQPPPLGSRTWKPEEEDYLMEKEAQAEYAELLRRLRRYFMRRKWTSGL